MDKMFWFRIALCVAALAFAFAFMADTAHAAGDGFDKEMASKKGMDALGNKQFDKEQMPGKFKIGLAIGSFVVMIIVVKWL